MADTSIENVLKVFELNDKQKIAAVERDRDVVVTAGAGSGKTRTLVARYTCLLAEGVPPRKIAAITFTRKAAMEMRSRVRETLIKLQQGEQDQAERQKWADLSAQMDSARIGTIHSLCTEILRNHPAEAGVDPRFEVLDEGFSLALRMQAVDDTIKKLVEEEQFRLLLANIPLRSLTIMLKEMLEKRLDAQESFETAVDPRSRLVQELRQRMNSDLTGGLIIKLHDINPQQLRQDSGNSLADKVEEVLRLWAQAEGALAKNDPVNSTIHLYNLRRDYLKGGSGKKNSEAKQIFDDLQNHFDKILDPLTGGKNPKDPKPSPEAEALFEALQPLLRQAFDLVNQSYQNLLQVRQALDFDDLEYYAQQLLTRDEIRSRWQQELDAVLVDEYQDTNQRQRNIVNALAGKRGSLFIVGDMRQSIYRFRRADVTVFREEQERIKREGGRLIDLDITYRAHEGLLDATGDLLAGVIGTTEDPARKYYVPYTPLVAHEKELPQGIQPPHVELVFGVGEDTESARTLAARALVERIHQLKNDAQIKEWDEVALLFRASTGFPYYEEALEEAGIPFVTVAGRGFYDRPEIRDLVNILRTLADPMDDLSFAGLLRSPAFGLSDASLYLLRQTGLPFWEALQGDVCMLSEEDQGCAQRVLDVLNALLPLVDRIPVADLLKKVVDETDYRAILATADIMSEHKQASNAGGRLWRNLDKLLEDAQLSQQLIVRDFLNLLTTLNDAGAREGEASAEAQGSVRLMTIHKAKGLEYPLIVLADAGRGVRSPSELVYFSNDLGVTFKLDPAPMLYNLAKVMNKDQDECEALRLLYVALTRAKSKLLISGHATFNADGEIKLASWAKDLDGHANMPSSEFLDREGEPFEGKTRCNFPVRVWCLLDALQAATTLIPTDSQEIRIISDQPPLYHPVEGFGQAELEEEIERAEQLQSWRATQLEVHVSGQVLGRIVHKAIQRWLFPGDPALTSLLEMEVFNYSLASEDLRRELIERATELLAHLRWHPLWEEIDSAQERYAELPYTFAVEDRTEHRQIDLLYRDSHGWQILDFKTDPILTPQQKNELTQRYAPQLRRYARVVASSLGQPVQARICFLDDQGEMELVQV